MRPFVTMLGLGFLLASGACGSGGDAGPSGPSEQLTVSGTWSETSQVTSNPCDLELPSVLTGSFQLVQNGPQLTATSSGDPFATGSINPTTGDFTLTGSFTTSDGTVTAIQSGRFSSSTRYTAESVLTISVPGLVCTIRTSDTGTRQ